MKSIKLNFILTKFTLQRAPNTVKPLNSGHLQSFKNLSAIERFPLLGGNLKKIVKFGT